ncbi:MAG TPA: hypothetical protein VEI94_09230 [Candidatus Bathyarchaeia archaeon]|nr:hypothetical protein [Candidatus Bathyarchaeia archaeon]
MSTIDSTALRLPAPATNGERLALAFATVLTAFALLAVPDWQDTLTDVCRQAAIFAVLTIVVLYVTRLLGPRGVAIERVWLALFLAGMPLVYVVSWLATGGAGTSVGWLWVEIAAFPLYAALAVLGLKRSPWLLAAGIAAHGIAWDAWHYLLGSPYIPLWYAIGCLLADVGISVYIVARLPAWRAAEPSHPQ